jgi:hypothetical protein
MDRSGIGGNDRGAIAKETRQIDGVRRRSFLRSGLLLGAATVGLTAASSVAFTEEALAAAQGAWFWCKNCTLIFHSNNALNGGNCPNGGNINHFAPHDLGESSIYQFDHDGGAKNYSSQPQWTWCNGCQVLFYGPDIFDSGCPSSVSGQHTAGSTTSYQVCNASPNLAHPVFQSGWNFCHNCKSLFHGGGNPTGTCSKMIGHPDQRHQPFNSTYWVAFFNS